LIKKTLTSSPAATKVGRPTVSLIPEGQRPISGRGRKAISQSEYSPIYAVVTLLYRTLQLTLGYDTTIQRKCVMAAGSNFAFKIAAKPLQTETWLLLTAYRNSTSPCPTVPSPTDYDVRFRRNTLVSLQTDDRRTHRTQGSFKQSAKK